MPRRSERPMANGKTGIRRGEVAARLIAAIPANYVLTSLATALLARVLWLGFGVDAANASVAATLLSFALFAMLALVAFGMRSVRRIWVGAIGAGIVLGAGLALSFLAGGRL